MKTPFLTACALGIATLPFSLSAQDAINKTRNTLEQWVETKQLNSKEKYDWIIEKTILEDTKLLLANELDRLNKAIAELNTTATDADENRQALAIEKEALTAGSEVVISQIGALEAHVKSIIKTFPEPLVQKLQQVITRLPDDPESTKLSMGERVQNIVAILSLADKFNTTLSLSSDSRKLSEDKVIQVTTIYWGLAGAYYVDSTGEYAGVGKPGKDGWEWTAVDSAGPQLKQLLDIYEGLEDIQFVPAPASIN
ncbi:MAG: DUF3450 family protein [Opitutaceae bacterium]